VKGAFAAVAGLTQPDAEASKTASDLQAQGFRVLAVAVGPPAALKLAGSSRSAIRHERIRRR